MRSQFLMRSMLFAALCGFLPFSLHAEEAAMGEASMGEPVTPAITEDTPVSATLDVEVTQLRLLLGGAKGKGVLHYQGKDYNFTVKAGTVGGVGYAENKSSGKIYFLDKLEDFAGAYTAATAGVAVGKGTGVSSYQNSKNVQIVMHSEESKGLGLFLGLSVLEVELEGQ